MKIRYYTDELNDDFAGTDIRTKRLPKNYRYFKKCPFRRVCAFVLYHGIATPIVFILQKTFYREKIVGKKKLRRYKKNGFFLYGNHTRLMGDAYEPSLIAAPKKAYILTGPDALSIPGIRRIVEDLGAVPVPTDRAGVRPFREAIRQHAKRGHIIAVYPEAHIWPGYIGIRRFPATSFTYPVSTGKPSFTFTVTYRKGRVLPLCRNVVYIDGPFFPDEALPERDRAKDLCDRAYGAMCERAKLSDVEKVRYIKKDEA